MTHARSRRGRPRHPHAPATTDGRPVAEDGLGIAREDDDEDFDAAYEMEIGLPLRAENYATGEPLVTVDYFGFERPRRDAVVAALEGLAHSLRDPAAGQPRFLLLEGRRADGGYHLRDLIAILTVRTTELRLETARSDVTDRVRDAVQRALGAAVRHLRRVRENPVGELLNR